MKKNIKQQISKKRTFLDNFKSFFLFRLIDDFKFFVDNHTLYADELTKFNHVSDTLLYNKVKSKSHHLFDCVEFSINQFPRDLMKRCREIHERRKKQEIEDQEKSIDTNTDIIESLENQKEAENVVIESNELKVNLEVETIIGDQIEEEKSIQDVEKSTKISEEEDLIIEDEREVEFDQKRFEIWFKKLIDITDDFKIPELDQIYCQIYGVIYRFKDDWNKDELIENLEKILK